MKSRNAGYILIAAKGGDTTTLCTFFFITLLHNLPPTGGHNLRRSRAFFIPDTYVLSAGLYDQRGEKAWRRLFQSPRCTIHGSREEGPDAFMNFTSPARRKLHKNS